MTNEEHVHNDTCEWVVDLGIPFTRDPHLTDAVLLANQIATDIETRTTGICEGGGAGFGFRDLQFAFTSEAEAEKAVLIAVNMLVADGWGRRQVLTNESAPEDHENYHDWPYVTLFCVQETEPTAEELAEDERLMATLESRDPADLICGTDKEA